MLRLYQEKLLHEICSKWETSDRICLQLGTGAGKTEIAITLIKSILEADSLAQIYFVVHRLELVRQVAQKLLNHGLNCNIGFPTLRTSITVVTIQTLSRKHEAPPGIPDLVIIDECHHATSKSYDCLFKPGIRILGLTATPKRLGGQPLSERFQVLVKGPNVETLISDGYLARPEIYVPSKTANLVQENRSTWTTNGGDYSAKSISEFYDNNAKVIYGDVIVHYRTLSGGLPTLVFCPSVQSVYETVQLFNDNSIVSAGIDGSLSDQDRADILLRFRSGEVKCLMSCDLISEGFDCPSAKVGIFLRPTKSLTIYLQQVGRLLRPSGNQPAIVIDHVDNTSQFGPPWIQRHWSLDGYGTRKIRDVLTGINLKLCTKCGNYIKNSLLICQHCGKVFKSKSKIFKTIYQDLQKITIESAQKLINDECQKILNKEKWKMLKTREDFVQFAAEKGWANPEAWADKKLAEKKANDDVFFNGNLEQLIVLFAKRKDIKDPVAKAKETLAKREELQKNGKSQAINQVYESGTLEEVIAFVKANKPTITNPEAYAAGVLRKRLSSVLEHGTPEQIAAAQAMLPPEQDKFTKMVDFAKSGKVTPLGESEPRPFTDDEAEKFARNVVRKQVKSELESGDPVRVRAAVDQLHVHNPESYTQAVLSGDK